MWGEQQPAVIRVHTRDVHSLDLGTGSVDRETVTDARNA